MRWISENGGTEWGLKGGKWKDGELEIPFACPFKLSYYTNPFVCIVLLIVSPIINYGSFLEIRTRKEILDPETDHVS